MEPSEGNEQRAGDRLLRPRDVLAIFPVSRSAWYQGIAQGRYPAGRQGGGVARSRYPRVVSLIVWLVAICLSK